MRLSKNYGFYLIHHPKEAGGSTFQDDPEDFLRLSTVLRIDDGLSHKKSENPHKSTSLEPGRNRLREGCVVGKGAIA